MSINSYLLHKKKLNLIAAKVTPQRQQNLISSAIQTPIAVQTVTSSSDFNSLSDIMATQAGASQLLLSQTHRTSTTAITSNTTVPTLQTTVSSVASALASQHGDRLVFRIK